MTTPPRTHTLLTTNPFDAARDDTDDAFHEECGVFGVLGHPEASTLVALGLHALQHRGQEGAGIVSFDGEQFNAHRERGLVGGRFWAEDAVRQLRGDAAIGHVRYSTAGGESDKNLQPVYADLAGGGLAIAHNGNLTNYTALRRRLRKEGAIFQSTSDTETILHLIARCEGGRTMDRLARALSDVEGAYSLVCLTRKKLIGIRDPYGVRPLVLGKIGDAYILSSETCALDIVGAEKVRDVEPGEMIVVTRDGEPESHFPFGRAPRRFCIFEYVYFARPDSIVEDRSVYEARKEIGRQLAKESPVEADVIVPVPDSGVPGALGFAEAAGVPFDYGIIRNHYVGRTFIQPTDNSRKRGVQMKHNPNPAVVKGKRIVLVDDSIVRGTTSIKIVQMMRDAGATEVHMRIASPPTVSPCFYGVDTPEKDKLLAARMNLAEMADHIGVDSLAFLSIDGLYRAVGEPHRAGEARKYCDACFTGDYPISIHDEDDAEVEQLSLLREVV